MFWNGALVRVRDGAPGPCLQLERMSFSLVAASDPFAVSSWGPAGPGPCVTWALRDRVLGPRALTSPAGARSSLALKSSCPRSLLQDPPLRAAFRAFSF